MLSLITFALACLNAASSVTALPQEVQPSSIFTSTSGFTGTGFTFSAGRSAVCLIGRISVSASAQNIKILYSGPPNQLNATQTIQELLAGAPTIYEETNGGPNKVSGTWTLSTKLCFPADLIAASRVTTVQLLTHGATLDQTYWDFAPGYSYIDAAAKAGYATFSYDRLGVGQSQHPDPIQVVQAAIQVEILHQLVLKLRSMPGLAGKLFQNVVGVGHSAGSTFTQALTQQYPNDFDAVILTGVSTSVATVSAGQAALNLQIANQSPTNNGKFNGIGNGYFTPSTQTGLQFAFFKYPNFDPAILTSAFQKLQTNTLGELLTFGTLVGPAASYTRPVQILNGNSDYVFCGGNCKLPSDQAAAALGFFYPAVGDKGSTYLVPNTGHNINQHKSAGEAFAKHIEFLRKNKL
ncbi:hypothetical protein GQ43DRAFT_465797 [Delitschia confertaspora ATCC 74209]|uniref:AB hydrolase-1 domain-containing protein n=1 Tax=Delitschia confertaspora ATCC 74209 TaxID=1513339 RepID=A0A9P4JK81_9PLEO|nr:hypothetical protein GQ43DRAFT_465797 [Delitschia confertaspora ATCC 74209]